MDITFKPGFLETVRGHIAVLKATRAYKRLSRAALASLAVGLPAFFLSGGLLAEALIGFPALWFPLTRLVPFAVTWRMRRSNRQLAGEQRYEFSPRSIRLSGPVYAGELSWEAITRVEESRDFFAMMLSDAAGLFVPKTALPNDEAVHALRHMLLEYPGRPVELDGGGAIKAIPGRIDGGHAVVVEFEVTKELLTKALRKIQRPRLSMILASLATVGILAVSWPVISVAIRTVGIVSGLGFALLLAGWPVAVVWAVRHVSPHLLASRHLRHNPAAGGTQRFAFGPEGILTSGPLHENSFAWSAIQKVMETDELFLFYIARSAALYVPKKELGERIEDLRTLVRSIEGPEVLLLGAGSKAALPGGDRDGY